MQETKYDNLEEQEMMNEQQRVERLIKTKSCGRSRNYCICRCNETEAVCMVTVAISVFLSIMFIVFVTVAAVIKACEVTDCFQLGNSPDVCFSVYVPKGQGC